jgi:hypothetical protein
MLAAIIREWHRSPCARASPGDLRLQRHPFFFPGQQPPS